MATPTWILPAYHTQLTGVLDVVEIVNAFDTTLVAQGWTEPSANVFQTPNDPWGRWFKLAFTLTSATELRCLLTDDQARAGVDTKRFDISGSGDTIDIFYSPRYVYIVRFSTQDIIHASLLSLSPESELAHNRYCIWNGGQATAGGFTGSSTRRWQQIDAAGVYADESDNLMDFDDRAGEEMVFCRDVAGGIRFYPAINIGVDAAGNRIRGRIYNAVVCHSGDADVGDERPVYIGDGTTAIFKALNMTVSQNTRLLIRKS